MITEILSLVLFSATALYDPSQTNKKPAQTDVFDPQDNTTFSYTTTTLSNSTLGTLPCGVGWLSTKDGLCHMTISFTESSYKDLKCSLVDGKTIDCSWKPEKDK